MRSGPWILSLCVVLGAAQGALADDASLGTFQNREPVTRPKLYYFSKSGNDGDDAAADSPRAQAKAPPGKTAGVARLGNPGRKNYYRQLFEEADRQDALRQQSEPEAQEQTRTAPAGRARLSEEPAQSEPAAARNRETKSDFDSFDAFMQAKRAEEHKLVEERQPARPQADPRTERAIRPVAAKSEAARKGAAAEKEKKVVDAGYRRDGLEQELIEQVTANPTPSVYRRSQAKAAAEHRAAEHRAAEPAKSASVGSMALPESVGTTGNGPMVSVRWVTRGDVNVGQECRCALVVRNAGKSAAKEVVVEAAFPRTVRLLSAEPAPRENQEKLVWSFDEVAGGTEKFIEIAMIPSKRGELATSANVRFTETAQALFRVEEPQLKLQIQGPHEVLVGESASQIVTVSNPGTGVAHDVVVEAAIPEGFESQNGKRPVIAIGSLAPGESRSVRIALAAVSGGDRMFAVQAKGSGGSLVQMAETKLTVIAPSLAVKVEGPGLRYVSRHAKYQIVVTNNSNAPSNNVRVVDAIPNGFAFVKASKGGQLDASGKAVMWFVGRLEPGKSAELDVDFVAKEIGNFEHRVRAAADNGAEALAKAATRVDGIASLSIEVADLDDPVEVGAETAYEIRVRNDGSKPADKVSLACELAAGVQLINCKGPTTHVVEDGALTFKPVPSLAPGQTIVYRVHIRGTEPGDLRLRARLMSESIQKPITVEETTRFYED
ncbi:MAG TPA: hypothetical protein VHB77_03645 [Planctomycetaceae bacterium]|nr:hypothetical protein [Planctomycetaceae bacterium]